MSPEHYFWSCKQQGSTLKLLGWTVFKKPNFNPFQSSSVLPIRGICCFCCVILTFLQSFKQLFLCFSKFNGYFVTSSFGWISWHSSFKLTIILAPPSQKQQQNALALNHSNYAFQKLLLWNGLYQISQTFLLSFSCFFEFSSFLFNSFSSLVIWASNPFFSFCHCCLRTKTHELISSHHYDINT